MSKEESINNLKTYIEEDVIYQENKPKSDFDKYCIGHCKDIETVLNYIKELEEEIEVSDNLINRHELEIENLKEENEHYKDLMNALETYYDITEEDLENSVKEDV